MSKVTVDFVASEPDASHWRLVLVEEGPWPEAEVAAHLRRVQDRLYNCVDVALDGGLWRLYPDSLGKPVTVRLDCYNVPELAIKSFFQRFSEGLPALPDYATALRTNKYITELRFELNCAHR
jgi:hypothetical protein